MKGTVLAHGMRHEAELRGLAKPDLRRAPAFLTAIVVLAGVCARVLLFAHTRALWMDEASLALNIVQRSYGQLVKPLAYVQGAPAEAKPYSVDLLCTAVLLLFLCFADGEVSTATLATAGAASMWLSHPAAFVVLGCLRAAGLAGRASRERQLRPEVMGAYLEFALEQFYCINAKSHSSG